MISRTSVEQYRGTGKSIPEIAKELGVVYILEGSAQKQGDEIRISARLTQANGDDLLWSKTYTRTYKEVFALQTQIANSIAKELEAKLSPRENDLINKAATDNLVAYDFYLRGREYITNFISYRKERDLNHARNLFRQALGVDSQFALAWVGLGSEYEERNRTTAEFLDENYLDSVLYYSNKAIRFDPDLSEAYSLRGRYFQNRGKSDSAMADQAKAISIDPNNSWAYRDLGRAYFFEKDYLKALDNYKKAGQLIKGGPQMPNLLDETATIHFSIGNFQTADSLIEKAIQLKPDLLVAYARGAWSATLQDKPDKALDYAKKMVHLDSNSIMSLRALWDAYLFKKDFKNALKYYEKEEEKMKKTGEIRISQIHRVGYLMWNIGKRDEARKHFDHQISTLKEALRLGRESQGYYYDLAATHAFLGQEVTALQYLREYEKTGFNAGVEYFIMVDPLFESLRSNKEFRKIVDGAQAEKAKIRDLIKELEMKGEL